MKGKIDTTRASRDGHEYHEAWTARKALQLLWPNSDLIGISVEGLSPDDQANASKASVEIADIALYFGKAPDFDQCDHNTIVQFKYSIAYQEKAFRASNAKNTITKFAKTFSDYKRNYGAKSVSERLDFQLITNQPIYEPLLQAIEAIARGSSRTGEVKKQGDQFIKAAGLKGKPLSEFAAKVRIIGCSGNLRVTRKELENLIIDWSATNDPIARERLGRIKDLVREKAGYAGTDQNLITRPDILGALKIGDADDLLPCKSRLTNVGPVVKREQLSNALERIESATMPVLIHAAGGVGKTVFLESLERKLEKANEVVFFDCFGGGTYRSFEDARHQPKQGLIHIANTLSFRGLCDPMLPETPDPQTLMRTFRRRLEQCVKTLSRVTPGRKLALLIDAVDNAVIAARQRSEDAFPIQLLESLDNEPIAGVKVVMSCRSYRKPSTYAKYDPYELRPFSQDETRTFLKARLEDVTDAEVNVAQARSGGNPRVLDYLLLNGRGLLDDSEIVKPLELTDLIQQRIDDALDTAIKMGYEQEDIDAFLAGLAVLPPPVPLDEYAGAHGIELSAVLSFASDMAPLLERTNQGLTFKDEPTETMVRERFASSKKTLMRVAKNLLARQDESVYAARALPGLLHELDDGIRLFELAFDDRIPASVTSTVGKRNIRYARLKAATRYAALKTDYDRLLHLLVELSTIAAVDQRGVQYILEHPELVVASHDDDAVRRLFETRSGWPGARHARLAIVYTFSGSSEEAFRHALEADKWIDHANRNRKDRKRGEGPQRLDIAAIPFFSISAGHGQKAAYYLKGWYDWYTFEVCEHIYEYSYFAQLIGTQSKQSFSIFINSLTKIGPITAALSFCKFCEPEARELIKKLARRCRIEKKPRLSGSFTRNRTYEIEDGLRKASALALIHGLTKEALIISLRARHTRPSVWSFRDSFSSEEIFQFIFRTALVAATKGTGIHEKDLLPTQLVPICKRIPKSLSGKDFRDKAKNKLSKIPRKSGDEDKTTVHPHAMNYDDTQNVEHFLNVRLEPLLDLIRALSSALAASPRQIDKRFILLIEAWESACKTYASYRTSGIDLFFQFLGLRAALFILWTRDEIKEAAVDRFLLAVHAHDTGAANLIRIVAILARRVPLRALAGKQAVKASTLIRSEYDVNYRATLYSDLARAMLPASIEEASHYFREGLEQMDAIGSGDYEFTNELLLFASTIHGDELGERDFHTLSNIAELNMRDEPSKFYWGAYGGGLAKAAGIRGLAKLSRLDDRNRISLSHTLLPYLIGLLECGKIEPRYALALNRLANPVEYWYSSTKEFAETIRKQAGPDREIITALIEQYRDDNPGTWVESTAEKLASLADEALGSSSELAQYLTGARSHHAYTRHTLNEQRNYHGYAAASQNRRIEDRNRITHEALVQIANGTDPAERSSLVQAITKFNQLKNTPDGMEFFFSTLRAKLDYGKRGDYLKHVCSLEHLFYYWKISELTQAKKEWSDSSASLATVLKSLAVPLITQHAHDLISAGRVSGSSIKEISDLTSVPVAELVLELIKVYSRPGSTIPGAAWLAFASFICPRTSEGQGQDALARLLSSDAVNLANNVTDGEWKEGIYPQSDMTEIAAGLIWRALGSPKAVSRWRAAHSMRDFAAFGKWQIINALVDKWSMTTAGPFQAPELRFFYMHARLWLLIALARLALDYPKQIAEYKDVLLSVVNNTTAPHVLMRHFAARALLACVEAEKLDLPEKTLKLVSNIDKSPYHRSKNKSRQGGDFYRGRPTGAPKPEFEFDLEYDFHKLDVDSLSRVFGKPCWVVADMMSVIVDSIDPQVSSMYESDARGRPSHRMITKFHGYGQQLGWHALFLAAGQLLSDFPVMNDRWSVDPWGEWLGRYLLTRDDGLWLSDGTDRTPLDTREILLEQTREGLAITGDRTKILNLAAIGDARVGEELVIWGRWFSADQIEVEITSALVEPAKAHQLAQKVLQEEPMFASLPVFDETEDDHDYLHSDKKSYVPWVVCLSGESRLDKHDPYGVSVANLRPRLARDYAALCKLTVDDPFGRVWHSNSGTVAVRAQAWGRDEEDREEGPQPGLRLFCRASVLKKILTTHNKHLLVLFNLQRYEKQLQGDSRFTHSVGVAQITNSLDVKYFRGRENHLHKLRY